MKYFTKMKFLVFCVGIVTFISPAVLFAWGTGHDYVNRNFLKVLPKEIKTFLGEENCENIVKWSHAPDTGVPFEKDRERKKYPLTDEEIAYLKSFGAKNLYCLHSEAGPGQGANFILLIRALEDKNPERTAFWIATLLHTIADDAACNHISLVHYTTYAICSYRNPGIKLSENGIGVDFAQVARIKEGKKVIDKLLKDYKPQIISNNPDEALRKLVLQAIDASNYANQREYYVIATYSDFKDKKIRERGIKALCEMGVYPIKKGADAVLTAWMLAKKRKCPVLTKQLIRSLATYKHEYYEKVSLKNDSAFTGLLVTKRNGPAIGIILEPAGIMNMRRMSFGGTFLMAAAMRTLNRHNIPYITINLNSLRNPEKLDPEKIPAIVLCAGKFKVSKTVKDNLKQYIQSGGHILWIGGVDGGLMEKLSESLKQADVNILPVTPHYGTNNKEIINKLRVSLLSPLSKVKNIYYPFYHNPDTPAGWQKPLCTLQIKPISPDIKILAKLNLHDKNSNKFLINIAAAQMIDTSSAKFVFIPEYLISPFLFTKKTEIHNLAQITLDEVGTQVFINSLKLITNAAEPQPNDEL